jgi:hypothetical protein
MLWMRVPAAACFLPYLERPGLVHTDLPLKLETGVMDFRRTLVSRGTSCSHQLRFERRGRAAAPKENAVGWPKRQCAIAAKLRRNGTAHDYFGKNIYGFWEKSHLGGSRLRTTVPRDVADGRWS